MIYCYNCGKDDGANAEFCSKCSTQLFHGMPGVMKNKEAAAPKVNKSFSRGDKIFYSVCFGSVALALIWAIIAIGTLPE